MRRLTTDNVERVSVEPTEGSSTMIVTPNWCDKTSWYWESIRHLGVAMVDSGDGLTFNPPGVQAGPWVDNYHAKYTNEDYLTTEEGHVPRLKVYVDAVEKTEQDPHDGSGGDYTVDYATGDITFLSAPGGDVTADVYKVGGSGFCVKPAAGKKLKIVRAECQFSKDVSLRDSVTYQIYVGGSPYKNPTTYKSMRDYLNESDGAFPVMHKTTNPAPSWRDLVDDVQILPWNYPAAEPLPSAYGAEIVVKLDHDEPFDGTYATATFYCLSADE